MSSVLSWIVLGMVAGFISSVVVNRQDGAGMALDIVVGIAGALLGGFVFQGGVSEFNPYSLVMAAAVAIILLLIWHYFRRASVPPPH